MKQIIIPSVLVTAVLLEGCSIPSVNNAVRSSNFYTDEISEEVANLRVFRSNNPIVNFYISYKNVDGNQVSKTLITKQVTNNLNKYGAKHQAKIINMPYPPNALKEEEFFEFKVPTYTNITFRLVSVTGSTTMFSCDIKKTFKLEKNKNYELVRFRQSFNYADTIKDIRPNNDPNYCKFDVLEILENGDRRKI